MKKPIRMLVFSLVALIVTSLWDKGFIIQLLPVPLIETAVLIAILNYIVKPITKVILLPLNILTLGLVSVIVYCFLFYLVGERTHLLLITSWTFPGFHFQSLTIQQLVINRVQNIALSSLSVSFIISLLEKLL